MTQRILPWTLILFGLLLTACDGNSTEPSPDAYFQKGTVAYQDRDWQALTLTETETVRIEVTEITSLTSQPVTTLGFSIGRVLDAECTTTYRVASAVGSKFSFRLPEDVYCFQMFDAGTIPVDGSVEYTLLIEP